RVEFSVWRQHILKGEPLCFRVIDVRLPLCNVWVGGLTLVGVWNNLPLTMDIRGDTPLEGVKIAFVMKRAANDLLGMAVFEQHWHSHDFAVLRQCPVHLQVKDGV